MKIVIDKVYPPLSVGKETLSVKVRGVDPVVDAKKVERAQVLLFFINGRYLFCNPESVALKEGRLNVLLRFEKDLFVVKSLFDYIGGELREKCFVLLPSEHSDPQLLRETGRLLAEAAKLSGRRKRDVLMEITAFRDNVDGRPDLRFVSERQLPVIRDKLVKVIDGVEGRL